MIWGVRVRRGVAHMFAYYRHSISAYSPVLAFIDLTCVDNITHRAITLRRRKQAIPPSSAFSASLPVVGPIPTVCIRHY